MDSERDRIRNRPRLFFLVGLLAQSFFAAEASAMYHPGLGRFIHRDPGPAGMSAPPRIGASGPASGGRAVHRDQAGPYADGMNLCQYVRGNPTNTTDPSGLSGLSGEGKGGSTDPLSFFDRNPPECNTCVIYFRFSIPVPFTRHMGGWVDVRSLPELVNLGPKFFKLEFGPEEGKVIGFGARLVHRDWGAGPFSEGKAPLTKEQCLCLHKIHERDYLAEYWGHGPNSNSAFTDTLNDCGVPLPNPALINEYWAWSTDPGVATINP